VTRRALAPPPQRWRVALAAVARGGTPESRRHKQLERGWVDELAVAGADETLTWDDDHGLLEGTRSNLFVLKGNRLATPPVARRRRPRRVRRAAADRIGNRLRDRRRVRRPSGRKQRRALPGRDVLLPAPFRRVIRSRPGAQQTKGSRP
jgi:hypothetical protein